MERVLDRLWIGSTEDFRSPLASLGFTGVLDLRDGEHPPCKGVTTHRLTHRDGDPWREDQVIDAVNFIYMHVQTGKVLVACAAGMSRSACMCIGYLVRIGYSESTAFELVRNARHKIVPITNMLDSVLKAVRA